MEEQAILMATWLFLDARMATAKMLQLDAKRFNDVLAMLFPCTTRADEWLRYCCQTLREQMDTKSASAYDFADTVHNAARLFGLIDGKLLIPQGYWDSEMQRFRKRYGDAFFADFIGDVVADETVERMRIENHRKVTNKTHLLQ